MKIQLLIAVTDKDYILHLSKVISERYADSFEVSVCSSETKLRELLSERRFGIALLDDPLVEAVDLNAVRLPVLLWDHTCDQDSQIDNIEKVRKYQRISTMVGQLLSRYAETSGFRKEFDDEGAKITVVWSPAGGCGKTTVALAYATHLISKGKRTIYLDLEPFSSTSVYFSENGKGMSSVFEKLQDGDAGLLLQSIRQEDSGSGIFFYGRPENYEDIEILTPEDITLLIQGAASDADEVVVDLGSCYDEKTCQVMEMADQVLFVTDASPVSQIKCGQFRSQHNLYAQIADKLLVVANRGGRDVVKGEKSVELPVVRSEDPIVVYKTLSGGYFKA